MLFLPSQIPGSRCWISFSCKEISVDKLETYFTRISQHPAFRPKVLAVGVDRINPNLVSEALQQLNKVNLSSRGPDIASVYEKLPYVVCPDVEDSTAVLDRVREWMGLGANVIGGGRGATPQDIRAIGDRVFQEVFDAMEDRAKMEEDKCPKDWSHVQDRLKKTHNEPVLLAKDDLTRLQSHAERLIFNQEHLEKNAKDS